VYQGLPQERCQIHLASPSEGSIEPLTAEDSDRFQADPCWAPDSRSLVYGPLPHAGLPSDDEVYLRHVDLASRHVTRVKGSEGLYAPKCAHDGRILAMDFFAQRAHLKVQPAKGSDFFKVRDPHTGHWRALTVDLPLEAGRPSGTLEYPTWSHDDRYLYAHLTLPFAIARFEANTGRLEVLFDVAGLGVSSNWIGLDPNDAPLVHRDAGQREILVMEWKLR